MEDRLIWVDEQDRIVGSGPKMRTHVLARLHRAFSLFLVDREGGQVLLQRRAKPLRIDNLRKTRKENISVRRLFPLPLLK